MKLPPNYTSGFGLGEGSKCRLCWRHSSRKAEFCVVKVALLSVWYYLIAFLIVFFILFSWLLNRIRWLTLLPFSIPCQFLVSVFQSKDLLKVNSKFFKADSKVCLVKCVTYSVDTKVNHNFFKVCVSRNVYCCVGQYY